MFKILSVSLTLIGCIIGIIICSILLTSNASYDNYSCQNISMTILSSNTFEYNCQYLKSNIIYNFSMICYNNYSLNCRQIQLGNSQIIIHITNQWVKFQLILGLCFSITIMLILLLTLATLYYHSRHNYGTHKLLVYFSMPPS